jgi:hypothetical protein
MPKESAEHRTLLLKALGNKTLHFTFFALIKIVNARGHQFIGIGKLELARISDLGSILINSRRKFRLEQLRFVYRLFFALTRKKRKSNTLKSRPLTF